jgi:flagellin-like hook-associated protein FlgL
MSFGDITLNAGMRANLLNLQNTAALMNRTQLRLSTAKKVNSAIDDAAAFFAAQAEMSRAGDLTALKDSMGEAVQTLKAADAGISSITKLIEQAKGLIAAARSATTADRATLATQFDDLLTQMDQLAADASYKGTNLLDSGTLTLTFNENATSTLTITGFDASSTGLSISAANLAWAADADIDAAATDLTAALSTLRVQSSGLSSNSGTIQIRLDFTLGLVNTLAEGAFKLVGADLNEEGANMQALQIQQQLGISALSLSAQSQSAILKLFA